MLAYCLFASPSVVGFAYPAIFREEEAVKIESYQGKAMVTGSRFALFSILFLLIASLACLLLLPTFLSTEWGREQALAIINRRITGKVEIQRIQLSWLSGQSAEGIVLKDPEGQTIASVERLSIQTSLFQMLRQSAPFGKIEIDNLNGTLATDAQGRTNIEKSISRPLGEPVFAPPVQEIVLSNVYLKSSFAKEPLSLSIIGQTKEGDLAGEFDLSLSLIDETEKPYARIVNFPTSLLDQIASMQRGARKTLFHALLGEKIDLALDKRENGTFFISINTPRLQGELEGKIANQLFSLKETSHFALQLDAESMAALTGESIRFLTPLDLQLKVNNLSFSLPFLSGQVDQKWSLLDLEAEIFSDPTVFFFQPIGKLNVGPSSAVVKTDQTTPSILFNAAFEIKKEDSPFRIRAFAKIEKPADLLALDDELFQTAEASVDLIDLPFHSFSSLVRYERWTAILGPIANVQLQFHTGPNRAWYTDVSVETTAFHLKQARLLLGKEIALQSPAEILLMPSKECLADFFENNAFRLEFPCQARLSLKQLTLPLSDLGDMTLQVESASSHLQFARLIEWGVVDLRDFSFTIHKKRGKGAFWAQSKGKFSLFDERKMISPILMEPIAFEDNAECYFEKENRAFIVKNQFKATNPIFDFQFETKLDSESGLVLTSPAHLSYTLTTEAVKTIEKKINRHLPLLSEPAIFSVLLEPTHFTLSDFTEKKWLLKGVLKAKHLSFKDPTGNLSALENLIVPWTIDALNHQAWMDLKGEAYSFQHQKPSRLSAHLHLWDFMDGFHLSKTKSELRLNFTGLPTPLLNSFFSSQDLSPLFGSILDINLKSFYDPIREKPGYLDMAVDSTLLHADIRLRMTDRLTYSDEVKKPVIRLTVTPQGYIEIQKLFGFDDERRLFEPATFTARLAKIDLPLTQHWIDEGLIDFQLSSGEIKWAETASFPWKLEASVSKQSQTNDVQIGLKAFNQGSIALNATIGRLFGKEQRFNNWRSFLIQGSIEGERLSQPFLQSVLPLSSERIDQIALPFGKEFKLRAHAKVDDLNGFCGASIEGPKGKLSFEGNLKKGILSLSQPLKLSFELSPEMIRTYLAPHPFLSSVEGAEGPILCTIHPSRFSLPLIPLDLKGIRIGAGELDLGKIVFRNEGDVKSVLKLIRSIEGSRFSIWFTPIYFDLNGEVLDLKRFDMQIAQLYSLASWGKINFANREALLVLGLPASTLESILGAEGLSPTYVLQIPFQIAKGRLEMDKKKIAARIAALLAQTHGGGTGKVLGNFIDLVLSDKGEPAPSPTTTPFPWIEKAEEIHQKTEQEAPAQSASKKGKKDKKLQQKEQSATDQALKFIDKWIK